MSVSRINQKSWRNSDEIFRRGWDVSLATHLDCRAHWILIQKFLTEFLPLQDGWVSYKIYARSAALAEVFGCCVRLFGNVADE